MVWARCETCGRWGPASERHAAWLRETRVVIDNHLAPYRLRAKKRDDDDDRHPCWFCNPPRPLRMSGGGSSADHTWLEQDQKRQVESADAGLEQLLAEAWWRKANEGGPLLNVRVEWQEAYQVQLASHPTLTAKLAKHDDLQAVFLWAEIPEPESAVLALALVGWEPSVIAARLGIQVRTVRSRLKNVRERFQLKGLPIRNAGIWGLPPRARARSHARSYVAEEVSPSTWSQKAS